MLPKNRRANKKDIDLLFKSGSSVSFPNLTFKFIKSSKDIPSRISFIAPKNVAKKAVDRNRLRRLGYIVLKNHIGGSPLGIVGVFIFRKYQDDVSILENEIKKILDKIN
ncbi:MAG: ribonuclease P protein component [Candidatus Nomurabacteria bacterium]|nr:ribonuclease P protein component [Candidatus Nomurabacteria bacterium]